MQCAVDLIKGLVFGLLGNPGVELNWIFTAVGMRNSLHSMLILKWLACKAGYWGDTGRGAEEA